MLIFYEFGTIIMSNLESRNINIKIINKIYIFKKYYIVKYIRYN